MIIEGTIEIIWFSDDQGSMQTICSLHTGVWVPEMGSSWISFKSTSEKW